MFDVETTVVNKHHDDYDVLIQRGTKWGNPFKDGSRNQNVDRFEKYFLNEISCGGITIDDLKELKGMRLGCSCKPKRCHGDFIAECVNLMFSDMFDHDAKEKFFNMEIKPNNEY